MFEETYNEFKLVNDLVHPNIVAYRHFVRQYSDEYDQYHIIMDLIEGKSLQEYMDEKS